MMLFKIIGEIVAENNEPRDHPIHILNLESADNGEFQFHKLQRIWFIGNSAVAGTTGRDSQMKPTSPFQHRPHTRLATTQHLRFIVASVIKDCFTVSIVLIPNNYVPQGS